MEQQFGFIGTGRMATALASGFVKAGLARESQIVGSDPLPDASRQFCQATGGRSVGGNAALAAEAETLFLAVKPQQVSTALGELRSKLGPGHLVISIVAGVPLATLAAALGTGARLVRVMSNTPALVGQGASAFCLGPGATEADATLVEKLLGSVGRAFRVDEKLLDAVTGLAGSGPAFVCLLIEALADGGVRMGLPRELAQLLAAQTVRGTAQMVLETGEHPAVLKDRVASPGGTTIAGLAALEQGGFRGAAMAAVEAATRRSVELGKNA